MIEAQTQRNSSQSQLHGLSLKKKQQENSRVCLYIDFKFALSSEHMLMLLPLCSLNHFGDFFPHVIMQKKVSKSND